MAYKYTVKVYGEAGHRQRQSFGPTVRWDFTDTLEGTRLLEFKNSDETGTNEYTLTTIVRDTKEGCFDELDGQIYDGYFENANTGRIEEVFLGRCKAKDIRKEWRLKE